MYINFTPQDGNTPLHIVAVRGDMSILEQILESNFPFNIINCANKVRIENEPFYHAVV